MSYDLNTREFKLAAGPISVDRSRRHVTVSGEDVRLTALEHRLLLALMERRGHAQSRQQLYADVMEGESRREDADGGHARPEASQKDGRSG